MIRSIPLCLAVLVGSFLPAASATAASAAFPAPVLGAEPTVINLPAPFERVKTGGGGRFLVFKIKDAAKLAIFDLSQLKVVKELTIPADKLVYAVGQDHLMVVLPTQRIVQRFSLQTFEREKIAPIAEPDFDCQHVYMGSASAGPLLLWSRTRGILLDVERMRPMTVQGDMLGGHSKWGLHITVSANGQAFLGWVDSGSGGTYKLMWLEGNRSTIASGPGGIYGPHQVQPNADATMLLTNGGAAYVGKFQRMPLDALKGHELAPTEDPRFFTATRGIGGGEGELKICTASNGQIVHVVKDLKEMIIPRRGPSMGGIIEPRVRYVPTANAVVSLPPSNQQIVVRSLDLAEKLQQSGEDFLVVTSLPSRRAMIGSMYSYQIEALSRGGGLKYTLESGPEGMRVSDTGQIEWRVRGVEAGEVIHVILTVADASGQEAFHAFDLATERSAGRVVTPRPRPGGSGTPTQPPVSPPAAPPVADAAEPVTIELGEAAKRMCTGGGGRYLVFLQAEAKKLTVVDAVETKIVGSISLPSADVLFAAGQDKLLVVATGQKMVLRYRLKDLSREKTIPLPGDAIPKDVLMGSGSQGPLLLWYGNNGKFLDIEQMKLLPFGGDAFSGSGALNKSFALRVSTDGKTFVGWVTGLSGQRYNMLRLEGNTASLRASPDGHSHNEHWAQPNADGSLVFRHGAGIYSRDFKVLSAQAFKGASLLPTEDPRFFLSVLPQAGKKASQATICTTTDRRAVYTVEDLEPVTTSSLYTRWGLFGREPRVRYLPSAHIVLTIPGGENRVVIRPLDLTKALDRSGEDYLFVISKPDVVVTVGSEFAYQMEVLSKSPGVKYRLESGPEGMTVSASGEVRWPIEKRPIGGAAQVIIAVSNSASTETFHSFDLTVVRPSGSVVTAPGQEPPAPGSGAPRSTEVVQLDEDRLEIPEGGFSITPGLDYRSLLLLQKDRLARLGPDGVTIAEQRQLPKAYKFIRERAGYFVAAADDPGVIDLIDKNSNKILKSFPVNRRKLTDLTLHPTLPICYVAFWASTDMPGYQFILYNERTGEGRESEDYIGNWLRVHPSGRLLIAGFGDSYESGSRLLFNPGRVHVVPEYGDISWLITYQLDRQGIPGAREYKEKAGGNGKGLRVSPDGARVTYLSHVGYPMYSGNLAGWDPLDLKKMPVGYAIKGKATTYELAYHPVLPMVASFGKGTGVFFHRETGQLQENRLELPPEGLGDIKIHRIYFSPDGKNLLFDTSVNEVHYLQKTALRLTRQELDAVARNADRPATAPPGVTAAKPVKVPLVKLDTFGGGEGKAMTARDVGRWFTDSVVVIRNSDSSGTGFVVGSEGYVVTCAHCVPEHGKISVAYRRRTGDKPATRTATARLLFLDDTRDLALLKIDVASPMTPVRLATGATVESGQAVTVIGNPGLGEAILQHTMTEGIVSNPDRDIDGQTLIQTSASVNPGSSGAPMFNARGLPNMPSVGM